MWPGYKDVTSPRVLSALFRSYGLSPRRVWGQNFLIDANIARKIVAAAEIEAGDALIEVGAGAGALTLMLARSGAGLLVLEIDRGLIRLLKDLLLWRPEVQIMEKDALKANWHELTKRLQSGAGGVKLVSNLPYNISGPFMYTLFKAGFPFSLAVLMFQKEVARRLVAEPGDDDYGALSVLCRYYTEGSILFTVTKNVFWPRPGVDSAVLKLQPRRRELFGPEEELFWKIVPGVFQQRRKTILNSMGRLFPEERHELVELLEKASIPAGSRPEDLDVGRFALLTRIIYNDLSKFS